MILDIESLRKDLIVIEDINTFLVKVPQINPANPQYTKVWKDYTKWCIEGFWGKEFGKYRFMPPTLFYYGNFFKMEDTDKNTKTRKFVKPLVRDLDWLIHYSFLEAQGFSGFKEDDNCSADRALINEEVYKELEVSSFATDRIRFNDLHSKSGKRKKFVNPREYLKQLHDEELGRPLYYNRAWNLMLFGSRGGGKAIHPSELIRVENGWKEIQHLEIGEQIYDVEGDLSSVITKTELQKDLNFYKLTLRDGREINSCEDHNWRVFDAYSREYKVYNTKFLFDNLFIKRNSNKNKLVESRFAIPIAKAISEQKKDFTIHPYVLGALIGDGGMTQGNVIFTTADQGIIDLMNKFLPTGYYMKHYSKYSYVVARIDNTVPPFNSFLKELGLMGKKSEHKFIPQEYLYSDVESKTWLLKGLMDTDGYSDNRHIEFYTSSTQLSKDFLNLTRSLGIACKHTIKKTSYKKDNVKIDCLDCNRISIYTDKPVFSLDRKLGYLTHAKNAAGTSKYDKSFIVNIEYIGKQDGICIGVDNPTKTYLTENYVVTHNSYSCAGVATQILSFDGIKEFSKEMYENPPTTKVILGAGITGKSAELVNKITTGLNVLGTDTDLGVWGDPATKDYEPNPFYRNWVGDDQPGNTKNPLRYEYELETPQGWLTKGTKSSLHHINYSDKKQDGAQAGAGGRSSLCLYEEIGLMPNFKDALLSNTAVVSVDGEQVGVQMGIGTSGNIDLIQQTRQVFENPGDYGFLEFDNLWETSDTKIGLFIPAYLTEKRFKDKNGNTDFERALKHYENARIEAASKDDPASIYNEKMNYPLIPSDMWVSNKGSYFPQIEFMEREKELLRDQTYKKLAKPVRLVWDSKTVSGVRADYDEEIELFHTFPYDRSMTKFDGGVAIYEEPQTISGVIPDDMYIFVHDPYVSDNIDEGGSLGVTLGFLNPKYTSQGFNGNSLVCSYIGKHSNGKKGYYDIQEKLIQYYGNPVRGLWFEANRGEYCKEYYLHQKKLFILAPEPVRTKNPNVHQKRIQKYGFTVGNQVDKVEMIDDTADWSLLKTNFNGSQKRVVETIPCLFLVQQIIQFELKGNFDAVSALLGFPLALKELEFQVLDEKHKPKHNPLAAISMNPNLFGDSKTLNRIRELNKQFQNET